MTGKIVIFGQYKSGTTAAFYKIRNSLPAGTRTLFEPTEFVPQRQDARRWVLAKVILGIPEGDGAVKYSTFMDFDKKIYLVRDPRDWVISGMLFLLQQQPSLYQDRDRFQKIMALLKQKEEAPESVAVIRILEQILPTTSRTSLDSLGAWIVRQHKWLFSFESQLDDHYVLRYEDLVDGKIEELECYLEMPLHGEAIVDRVHDHVVRTKSYGNWRHWFLEQDVRFFQPLLSEYIQHYGYSNEWHLHERPVIDPRHCSEYVARVVVKRRGRSEVT
jgi:hypothetical protein